MEAQVDATLQASLDKEQYNESNLVELRIPINLPYYNDWDEFESYDGETTINGQHYRYVKRKVVNGELILLCIPNKDKTKLASAGNEYFKKINDLQNPSGKKSSGKEGFAKFISDYTCFNETWKAACTLSVAEMSADHGSALLRQAIIPPAQPPDC